MSTRAVSRILVAGAGAMGAQIALVAALAGRQVALYDVDADALDRAVDTLRKRTASMVAKGRRDSADVEDAFARLHTTTELTGDHDLVIEAIVEKLDVKREFFTTLDSLCPGHTILASNSSSFLPSSLASATSRPDRFVNLHFFNPALVMKCVEVVRGPETSDTAVDTAVALIDAMEKTPVVLDREIPGFVANRLLNAVRDEAIALYEGGYADIDAIDTAARTALGYPMGPFELMDLTGIDIGYLSKKARFAETADPADRPSATVTALVEAGHLGRKSGRGFYRYDESGARVGKGL